MVLNTEAGSSFNLSKMILKKKLLWSQVNLFWIPVNLHTFYKKE